MKPIQHIIKYLALAFAVILIVGIFEGIYELGSAILTGIYSTNSSSDDNSKYYTYEIEDKPYELSINLKYSNLKIVNGDKLSLESNDKYIKFTNEKNRLVIDDENRKLGKNNNFDSTLTIPRDTIFNSVSIINGAGKLNVDSIKTNSLNLSLGAGATLLQDLTVFNNANIETGAGKLDIASGSINNLDFEMGVGAVNITSNITGFSKIDSGIGSLNLNILNTKNNYTLDIDNGLGKMMVDNQKIDDDVLLGTGANKIELDVGIGSINIDFID